MRTHSERIEVALQQQDDRNAIKESKGKESKEDIEERLKSFQQKLEKYIPEYGDVMVKNFYNYWREKNEAGNKMRFEKEKVFDINLRLKRWKANQSNFSNSGSVIKPKTEMVATADGGLIDKNELNRIFKQ